jgi:Flp pilus assembly protein TadG
MITGASLKNRQGGAVAVMAGISIVVLVGFLALVIDLGHVYVAKTELQNAADAAALSGAKELNGTYSDCCDTTNPNSGVNRAIAIAAQNNYDFTKPVNITIANISVGSCPSDTCMVLASTVTTDAAAANKTFLKIDTDPRPLDTWFAPVFNLLTGGNYSVTSTFGMAVAGRYTVQITPLGVCAVEVAAGTQAGTCSVLTVNSCNGTAVGSVKECGFLRGVAYNIPDLNPLSNGDLIWINPVDAMGSGTCDPSNGNTPILVPFLCTGQSAVINALPGCVWVNTGVSATPAEHALNSRFGDYFNGVGYCDPAAAPPDTHVQEFTCTQVNGVSPNSDNCVNSLAGSGSPWEWMDTTNDTTPTRQSIEITAGKPVNYPGRPANFSQYGVLWSFSKEIKDFTTTPYTEYGTGDWPTLYGGDAQSYPATSPYLASPSGTGVENRRVLNVAIIDCSTATGFFGATCNQRLPVLAIGKFFMQRKAEFGGSPKKLFGEFAGLVAPPLPPADIRLYR